MVSILVLDDTNFKGRRKTSALLPAEIVENFYIARNKMICALARLNKLKVIDTSKFTKIKGDADKVEPFLYQCFLNGIFGLEIEVSCDKEKEALLECLNGQKYDMFSLGDILVFETKLTVLSNSL